MLISHQLRSGYLTDILEAELRGVSEALQNLTDLGAVDPVVKATVVISESGFVSIQDAIAFGEVKHESLTGKFRFYSFYFIFFIDDV